MATWIEVKARYEKRMDNGVEKFVVEPYLVDAMSCTEAEARVVEELTPFTDGNMSVTACSKTKFAEVFNLDGTEDRFYRAKVNFITIDEKTAAEKKTATFILVRAADFYEGVRNLREGMKGTMADWELESLSETKIVDVYRYKNMPQENDG